SPGAQKEAADMAASRSIPAALRTLVERRAAQVIDYQGPRLAEEFVDLVALAAGRDTDAEAALSRAVIDSWFKLLTYKDEYEVARFHLRLDLDEAARQA